MIGFCLDWFWFGLDWIGLGRGALDVDWVGLHLMGLEWMGFGWGLGWTDIIQRAVCNGPISQSPLSGSVLPSLKSSYLSSSLELGTSDGGLTSLAHW